MLADIEDAGLDRNDVEIRPGAYCRDVAAPTMPASVASFSNRSASGEDYIPSAQRYAALPDADWVHLGTNSSPQLVRRLVADGVPFSIDVSTRHFALPLDGVPLVFASGPDDPADPVSRLLSTSSAAAGAHQVVVTCGKRGSYLRRRQWGV